MEPPSHRRDIGTTVESAVDLECPTQERGAGSEAGAYGGDQQEVAFLQLAFFERGLHGDGNRACGGVAEAVDINHDLLHWHAEALGRSDDDAAVGLVSDEAID